MVLGSIGSVYTSVIDLVSWPWVVFAGHLRNWLCLMLHWQSAHVGRGARRSASRRSNPPGRSRSRKCEKSWDLWNLSYTVIKPIMSLPCKTRMWKLNPVILYCVLEWRRNRNVVLNNHGKVWFFATYRSTNFFLDDNSLRFYTRAVSHNGFSGCYGFVLANILLPITCIE